MSEDESLAGKRVQLVRKDGMVTVDWIPAARVEYTAEDAVEVKWHGAAVERFSINKSRIRTKFDEGGSSASASSVQWCL